MNAPQSRLTLGFYRQCRLWHGYLSAFAFGALLFFAVTGISLNHPNWFAAEGAHDSTRQLLLTSSQLAVLRKVGAPAPKLTEMVSRRVALYGTYQNAEADSEHIYVRMRGVGGSSDIRADLLDGSVTIDSERATPMEWLNALHRGEQTGAAWRAVIDIAAGLLIAVALIGYAIFFSMRARLTSALLITALSVVGIAMFCIIFVH